MISFIVAMDQNHVIGFKNKMPWHLPKDLRFFKEKTINHTIIMGRKTFESIGRVLPHRRNVVLTTSKQEFPEGVEVIEDLSEILNLNKAHPDEQLFVIGGGKVFEQLLPYADRLYITKINESFEGDTYFPPFSEAEWVLSSKEQGIKDENNPHDYTFLQYDRK